MSTPLQGHEDRFRQPEPQLAWNWMKSSCECAYWVQITGDDFDPTHAGVFWLRLYGVLVELPPYLQGVDGTSAAMKAIEDVRASLTDDELMWTQYRRDTECHAFLDLYAPMKQNGTPKAAIKAKTLTGAPDVPWADFDAALTRAVRSQPAFGVKREHSLARHMAAKVVDPLTLLLAAVRAPMIAEANRVGMPFLPGSVIPPPTKK